MKNYVLLLVLGLLVVFGGVYWFTAENAPGKADNIIPKRAQEWSRYHDSEIDISIQHPNTVTITQSEGDVGPYSLNIASSDIEWDDSESSPGVLKNGYTGTLSYWGSAYETLVATPSEHIISQQTLETKSGQGSVFIYKEYEPTVYLEFQLPEKNITARFIIPDELIEKYRSEILAMLTTIE